MPPLKRVAALVSSYFKMSHADVILQQAFNGYPPGFTEKTGFQIVSMVTDQVSTDERRPDMSRDLAKTHGFKICDTVREALTLGGDRLAVDGVLDIFEHGNYPTNRLGQTLYPRRKYFEKVVRVFEATGQSVPVFNDKHLAVKWDDAAWMVERSRKVMFPFMAGSSLPYSYRQPDLVLPLGCELTAAVAIGYGHVEHYGFHALEGLQCMIERRRFAGLAPGTAPQQGVAAVTTHTGPKMWEKLDGDPVVKAVFEAALSRIESHAKGDIREVARRESSLFEIEYRDGLRAFVVMPGGWVYEGDGGAFTFAAQVKGEPAPVSTLFYLDQRTEKHPHFALMVKGIDAMFRTGHAVVPVERTLLTTGILEMAMRSRFELGQRIATPHLDLSYKPATWPHGGPLPDWVIAARKQKK